MAFTLICHVCGHKLKLFDSSIKKRKGMIRCPHCSARISYDLDSRKIQKSGFWATEEPAFDYRTRETHRHSRWFFLCGPRAYLTSGASTRLRPVHLHPTSCYP